MRWFRVVAMATADESSGGGYQHDGDGSDARVGVIGRFDTGRMACAFEPRLGPITR